MELVPCGMRAWLLHACGALGAEQHVPLTGRVGKASEIGVEAVARTDDTVVCSIAAVSRVSTVESRDLEHNLECREGVEFERLAAHEPPHRVADFRVSPSAHWFGGRNSNWAGGAHMYTRDFTL